MTTAIRHNIVIKASPEKIYQAITTQEGLSNWWAKQTMAKPELGFVNVFTFGDSRNDMKISKLITNSSVEWTCIDSIEEWIDTKVTFDLEEKEGKTLLRFSHSGWRNLTDTFAECNYHWGKFMTSLKSLCETGTGTPS
jgi:uncharacterized protein YndB with AHSA1/START domain